MASLWQGDSTVIDRVRIRAAAANSGATRHIVERLLSSASLRPVRLPVSAVLIIRKLQGRMPASRLSNYNHLHALEWERALNAKLDRLVADAARPAQTTVPESAQAVLFADRAEMLACLAGDWLRGIMGRNWWWSSLLRRGEPGAALTREWTSSAEFVPLAMEHLSQREQAVAFAKAITDELADTLLSRMLNIFGIPQPNRAVQGPALVEEATTCEPALPVLCRRWSPEAAAPGLSPLKRTFLTQVLTLRRSPGTARSVAFQTLLAEWREATHSSAPDARQPNSRRDTGAEASPALVPEAALAPQEWMLSNSEPMSRVPVEGSGGELPFMVEPHAEEPQKERPAQSESGYRHERSRSWITENDRPATSSAEGARANAQDSIAHELDASRTWECAGREALNPAINFVGKKLAERVQSTYAGVFFLVNVALALGLYSDFTSPQGRNLELDIWDFLWLMRVRLGGEGVGDDPISAVLAGLAGRTVEQVPGANFRPSAEWRIPATWLDAFPEPFEATQIVHEGRVRVMHPVGFPVEDKKLASSVDDRADPLQRWADWVAAYLRARLNRALGRNDAAWSLCRIAGVIETNAMRVDVHYPLQAYPIEVRLAGLDRDPGWVPAAGHYIAYHFE